MVIVQALAMIRGFALLTNFSVHLQRAISECSFITISRCLNDDGCCPNNCEFANDNDCACVPDTCNSLNLKCGNHPDGCGATLNCGTCATGACNNAGQCVGGMDGDVGDSCTDGADCSAAGVAAFCLAEPDGYCSATCVPSLFDCPTGSECVGFGVGVGECRKACTNSNQCRPQYSCVVATANESPVSVCLPN